MKRRLIKQGANALTITVPKEWTQMQNLESGDEVDASIDGGLLVLRAQAAVQKKKTCFHLPAQTPSVHRFLIANAYRAGYDEIELTYESASQLADVQSFIEELLGVEITSQKERSVLLKVVALPDQREYDVLFRRIFHIIETALDYLMADMKTGAFDPAKMSALMKNLLRLSNFCSRLLLNQPFENKSLAHSDFSILKLADYWISECCYLYGMIAARKKVEPAVHAYLDSCRSFFKAITQTLFKPDLKGIAILLALKGRLFDEKNSAMQKVRTDHALIQEISILFRLFTVAIGPLSMRIIR